MKVICVVDSITDINAKIDFLASRFGGNVKYVVHAPLVEIFKTYDHTPDAIYNNNLALVAHLLLSKGNIEDLIVYYTSLVIDDDLMNRFISLTGKGKVVDLVPKYNAFEQAINGAYNLYVKTIFKSKDTLASPKLQYLPSEFVEELITTHFGNRLFEIPEELTFKLHTDDKKISETSKVKNGFNKKSLLFIIALLVITLGWIITFAYVKVNFILVFVFVLLYLLDILLLIIHCCKIKFDSRFLR